METPNNGYNKAYYEELKKTVVLAVHSKTGWGKKNLLTAISTAFSAKDHPDYVYGIYHSIRARMPKEAKNIGSKQAEVIVKSVFDSTQAFLERTKGTDLSHRDYDPFFLHKSLSEKINSKSSWGKNQLYDIILDSTLNGQHYPDKVYKAHFIAGENIQNGKSNISAKDACYLLNKSYSESKITLTDPWNYISKTSNNKLYFNDHSPEAQQAIATDLRNVYIKSDKDSAQYFTSGDVVSIISEINPSTRPDKGEKLEALNFSSLRFIDIEIQKFVDNKIHNSKSFGKSYYSVIALSDTDNSKDTEPNRDFPKVNFNFSNLSEQQQYIATRSYFNHNKEILPGISLDKVFNILKKLDPKIDPNNINSPNAIPPYYNNYIKDSITKLLGNINQSSQHKSILTMENQNNEKKESVQLDGFLTKDPKVYTFKDQEHAVLQIGVKKDDQSETVYHDIKVSPKFIDSVKDLKKGTEITVSGYPKTEQIKDKNSDEKKDWNFIQAATDIKKFDKTVTYAGNISSEITDAKINGKDNKFFSIAVNSEDKTEGAKFYNIRVSEKFFDSVMDPKTKEPVLKTGDFVQVKGFPKSYTGQDKEGNPQEKNYVQLSENVKLLKAKQQGQEASAPEPKAETASSKKKGKGKAAEQSPAL